MVIFKKIFFTFLLLLSNKNFSQVSLLGDTTNALQSFNISSECLSKSKRTPKPSIISLKKEQLIGVKSVKQFFPFLNDSTCKIVCASFKIFYSELDFFEFRNIGDEIIYDDKFPNAKLILVDNLVSTIPDKHFANYKFTIEGEKIK